MQKWEYLVTAVTGEEPSQTRDLGRTWQARLNELGAEGWELVSEQYFSGRLNSGSQWNGYSGTLKRPQG